MEKQMVILKDNRILLNKLKRILKKSNNKNVNSKDVFISNQITPSNRFVSGFASKRLKKNDAE